MKRLDELTARMEKLDRLYDRMSAPPPVPVTVPAANSQVQPTVQGNQPAGNVEPVAPRSNPSNAWKHSIECYGCGGRGHIKRDCPNRRPPSKNTETAKTDETVKTAFARPLHKEESCTFLTLRHRRSKVRALLDTGSDVSLVSRKLAKKYKWPVRSDRGDGYSSV